VSVIANIARRLLPACIAAALLLWAGTALFSQNTGGSTNLDLRKQLLEGSIGSSATPPQGEAPSSGGQKPAEAGPKPASEASKTAARPASSTAPETGAVQGLSRQQVLVGSLTIFVLAIFVGFEVIAKVPPTLHTPLMSGSNAISGITVVGALILAAQGYGIAPFVAFVGVVLAMTNVVGGFMVTHRMLAMFIKKR
jgi:NAD(P) transhydrogenase subunit alpha